MVDAKESAIALSIYALGCPGPLLAGTLPVSEGAEYWDSCDGSRVLRRPTATESHFVVEMTCPVGR